MVNGQSSDSAFTFLSQGAIIQEFLVADENIVLGFPSAELYKSHNAPYFGETIGRTTNRVKNARLNLNGKTYQLEANDGPNCLHGGARGWGKQDFEGPTPVNRHGREGVKFTYLSKDGDGGYPGTVLCTVWYVAGMEDGKTVLDVEYQVEFVGDECGETVVGVTNHRYINPVRSSLHCIHCPSTTILLNYKSLHLARVSNIPPSSPVISTSTPPPPQSTAQPSPSTQPTTSPSTPPQSPPAK